MIRTYYETPVGTVSTLKEPAGFTSWYHELMLNSPDDYKVLRFIIKDAVYQENYSEFLQAQEAYGEGCIFRASFGLEPLQALISGPYMKMETFCIEWMERRDEILALYDLIVQKQREIYPLVAASPALFANYGGNIVPEIISPKLYREYYLPHYNEAAEIMHKHGKLIGSHYDDDCGTLAEAIAESDLDYIEAFTPAPDTDMTLGDARKAWPNKVLWLNFPSSQHLRSDDDVERITVELLDQIDDPSGVIMGITEDIPEHRWYHSCRAIMNGLDRHASKFVIKK